MLNTFVNEYLGTLIVGVIVAAIVGLLIFKLVKSHKKTGCGCGCASCSMGDKCHSFKNDAEINPKAEDKTD